MPYLIKKKAIYEHKKFEQQCLNFLRFRHSLCLGMEDKK